MYNNSLGYKLFMSVVALMLTAEFSSCREDSFDYPDYVTSGVPTIVSLNVSVPNMDKQTRAAIDDYNLDYVKDLWVRSYSKASGEATSAAYTSNPGTHDTESDEDGVHDLNFTIETLSGENYIVGVANSADNNGFSNLDPDKTVKPLSQLLEDADTWEKFLNIVALSPSNDEQINQVSTPIPMAGCYLDIATPGHGVPYNISQWQTDDFTPYFIPVTKGVQQLNGAIHLRRLVSNIKFNFVAGDNIELEVNSYKVVNAPKTSWLYERYTVKQTGNQLMLANYGDLASSEEDASNYYVDESFLSNLVRDGEEYGFAKGSYAFDFWIGENKHDGNDKCNSYKDREARPSVTSSLFSALCDNGNDIWTPNQLATYVIVSCTVDYKELISVDDKGEINGSNGSISDVYRTGVVDYIIHLGDVNGSDEASKSKDFNVYRNASYTYTVTVNGVNDIRVDAIRDDEFPGEEGIVTDLSDRAIELDAHYHTFNIQITETERKSTGFGYLIMTYRSGEQYIFDNEKITVDGTTGYLTSGQDNSSDADRELYNWIELRPTTGADVLAEYKPRSGSNSDGLTFLLTNIENISGNQISASEYYTVFVNEYTYEPMYDGTNTNNNYGNEAVKSRWREYVNQNPRRFFIKTTREASEDGNSIYTRSKYGVSQYSMETYYANSSSSGEISSTALGVERFNETEGLNMRRQFNTYGTYENNGRYNIAQWLGASTQNGTVNVTINGLENSRPLWSDFVNMTVPQEVKAVTGERAQNGPELPARTIEAGNPVKLPQLYPYRTSASYTFTDPQYSSTTGSNPDFIEAINACMNRNRDKNGNGRIDPSELRWYVPTMLIYLRLIIGEESLNEPLMDYNSISGLPKLNNNSTAWTSSDNNYTVKNDYCSRYMFISSYQYRVLWGMEGTSSSSYQQVTEQWTSTSRPWQVRCVRNLGTNMTSVSTDNSADGNVAYELGDDNTINMTYFDIASIRNNPYYGNGSGSGQMPLHLTTSSYNTVSRKFEYASANITVTTSSNKYSSIDDYSDYINDNPCSSLTDSTGKSGWRVPNQKELTILRDLVLSKEEGYSWNDVWLSCTGSYFKADTGIGGGQFVIGENLLLMTYTNQGTMMTENNRSTSNVGNVYVRCVRDL